MTAQMNGKELNARPLILLADDRTLVAEGCKHFLDVDFEIVAVANDGRIVLEEALRLKPDVVILDVVMPTLSGLDAGQQIKQKLDSARLVYLTTNAEPATAAEAFKRGASAYVLRSSAAEELSVAVHAVLRGESYITPIVTKNTFDFLLQNDQAGRDEPRITPRQAEILQLLSEGKSMKEVADILHVKTGTVAFHKYKIMETLGLRTNADLLRYAIEHHLIT